MLAPDFVEAILEGKQESEVTLARVLEPFPMEWIEQSGQFGKRPTTAVHEAIDVSAFVHPKPTLAQT